MNTYLVTFVDGVEVTFEANALVPDASVGGMLALWDSANNRAFGWIQAENVASIAVTYPA